MADEPTFAEQQVTGNTLSESDQIRKRITDYKAQITPNSLQVIEVMLQQQLSSGLLKPGDLDAMIILRDDVNKAYIDYRTQLENAQRRLADLAQDEAIEKAQAEEAKIAAIVDARDVERQRRKDAESRLAQVEAVLASHGISMDLNADGVIGLAEGQVADELTAEEQAQVDNIVSVEKDNIAEIQQTALAQPVEPKQPSRAFELARALNPEPETSAVESLQIPDPTDEQMEAAQAMIEELDNEPTQEYEYYEDYGYDANGSPTREVPKSVPQSETTQLFQDTHDWADNEDKERKTFEEWNEEQAEQVEEREHVLDVPEDAKGTEEFLEMVEEVEKKSQRTELADGVYIEEREVEEPSVSEQMQDELEPIQKFSSEYSPAAYDPEPVPQPSAPVITASQLPGDVKTFAEIDDYPTTQHDESDDLEDAKRVEEEYDEVTIPTESELKGMTKKNINAQAVILGFDVPTSLNKTKMIESFMKQTEEFISSLQESGEFISAESTDTTDSDDDDTDNIQDGGYF